MAAMGQHAEKPRPEVGSAPFLFLLFLFFLFPRNHPSFQAGPPVVVFPIMTALKCTIGIVSKMYNFLPFLVVLLLLLLSIR